MAKQYGALHAMHDNALRAGSGVEKIDTLRFLAVCRKMRLNQALSVLSPSTGVLSVFSAVY